MSASCFDRFGNPKKGYSTKQEAKRAARRSASFVNRFGQRLRKYR